MDIAVYSGSFNPLHIGHLAILRNLVEKFDKVLLVVSPKNPLKDIDGATGECRFHAAVEAVARHPELDGKVEVSDIELHLPQPNYTYVTLDVLQELHPDDTLTLVTGGDQIANFSRWREYRHILLCYGLAAFPREGYDNEAARDTLLEENPDYRITLLDMPLVNVSSSEIRAAIAAGADPSELLM